jgi:hypothetical protein
MAGMTVSFPSSAHAAAAAAAVGFVSTLDGVEGVLLVGSCARRADGNDLDLSVLVGTTEQGQRVQQEFAAFATTSEEITALTDRGRFMEVELGAITGEFGPGRRGWTTGPDDFELAVGNEVAYSKPLWVRGERFEQLRSRWLPYYGEELRHSRLAEARMYVVNDLDHVPLMLDRGEPFHAFHRLYMAFQGFLQALFIARRTYPIAYDKWIQEQVEDVLGLPQVYRVLPSIVGVDRLDQSALANAAERLRALLDEWAPAP